MLSVAIHKDIAEYQPKVIGKLTGRTLISITVALGLSIAVAVYMNLVLKIDPTDHLEFIYAVSLPCWCCGFWKPHGLPFEQFALLWLQHQLSDNRLFYKPSMFKSGFVKTPDEITQSRKSHVLDGAERLALLNSQLNPLKPFNFDYRRDISARMVQTTKDCIAPMTLDFKPEGLADCFKTGDMWGQVLVIKKLGSELTDQALSDITELPIPLNVTWFAQPMDKAAAVAFTRQRLAWIDKEIIEEQRSAVQKGYDFSILPQELKYSKEETEDVIDNLQNKNQLPAFPVRQRSYRYSRPQER